VGGRGAVDFADVQADAVVGEAHEAGHGYMVEVGYMVPPFFQNAVGAGGRFISLGTGANRKLQSRFTVDEVNTALRV